MAMTFDVRPTRPLPPAGLSNAVIVGMYNVGSIWNPFNSSYRVNVIIQFELDKRGPDGKPIEVSATLTGSMDPKATMRKWIESLLCRSITDHEAAAMDVGQVLVGAQCQVQITHGTNQKGDPNHKVANVLPPAVQIQPSKQPVEWDYRTGDLSVIPEWVAKRHAMSREYTEKYPNQNGPVEQRIKQSAQYQAPAGQQRSQYQQPAPQQYQPPAAPQYQPPQQQQMFQPPAAPAQQYQQPPQYQQPAQYQQPPQQQYQQPPQRPMMPPVQPGQMARAAGNGPDDFTF